MLCIDENWVLDENNIETKKAEYRVMDFYGPFLELNLKKYKDGQLVVKPIKTLIETSEITRSHFDLLSKASEELYERIGKFILKTQLFNVTIDSAKTEELLIKEFKKMRLF